MSQPFINTVIVVSGKICSGKTTIARFLADRWSFPLGSFGGYLFAYCQQNNLPTNREYLQELGQNYIQNEPEKFLAGVISYFKTDSPVLILDGVRHKLIFELLKNSVEKFYAIFAEADTETRYKRYLLRQNLDYDDFLRIDSHPVELETEELKPLCNLIVDTSVPLDHHMLALDAMLGIK